MSTTSISTHVTQPNGCSATHKHSVMDHVSLETAAAEGLSARGFYVVSSLLSPEERTNAIHLVENFCLDISYLEVSYPTCDGYGSGWLLGDLREILAERVYEPLLQTRELISSKEGFTRNANLTPENYITTMKLSEVIRAAIVLKGSPRIDHSSISKTGPDESSAVSEVELNPGDVLLWKSSLTGIELVDEENSLLFHCTMIPASMIDTANIKWRQEKLDAYLQRRTGGFYPQYEHWIADDFRDDRRHYYRIGPPLVTTRQAELYGLIPYERDEEEINRAVVRGVRFVDYYESKRPQLMPKDNAHLEFLTLSQSCGNNGLIMGQDKYLGGIESPCGKFVYGVPGTAHQVLRIELETKKIDLIGPRFPGKFKWLRGVPVPPSPEYPSGCCVALPCNSFSILKIVPDSNDVYSFGETAIRDNCTIENGWLYHGGNFSSATGCIYAIPANANKVMKFNPYTDEVQFIGPDYGVGKQKWYGGIEGSDGCIYGIPHNETGVLKIDPITDNVEIWYPETPFPQGRWKWHGGLRSGHKIYGFPNNADQVLVIDCQSRRIYVIGEALKSGRHRDDNCYKYLGGALTHDERFAYLFPCDAERVLKIDCLSDETFLIGPTMSDGANKFQNGFAGRDGCLYGIPQRAPGVLRIVPEEGGEDLVDVMDCGMMGVKDKFEGGVMGADGCIYCIPLRAKMCVKVVPGSVSN